VKNFKLKGNEKGVDGFMGVKETETKAGLWIRFTSFFYKPDQKKGREAGMRK
jgi:hypothetical protein